MNAQISLFEEISVDCFAGGGGTSTGYEKATTMPVTIAINHDPDAVLMHKTNHPYTKHYCENVWAVDPYKATQGRKVGMAWFSPDCKHFSRAKGDKPVEKKIRGLAWVVTYWAGTVRPRVIFIENVVEFMDWGPLVAKRDTKTGRCWKVDSYSESGKPIVSLAQKGEQVPVERQLLVPNRKRRAETFRKWKKTLEGMGYVGEFKALKACDYGAPTSRERLCGIFRCDGKPIVWPEKSHGNPNSPEVKSGKLLPYRTAAEIIDWSKPLPSIFESKEEIKEKYGVNAKRPLAPATLRRIARGINKFVMESANPYLLTVNHSGEGFRGQGITEPVGTMTAKNGFGVVAPTLIQYHGEQGKDVRGQDLRNPIMTVDASNRYGMVAATMVQMGYGEASGQKPRVPGLEKPLGTVVAKEKHALATAHLIKLQQSSIGQELEEPIHTIMPGAQRFGIVSPYLVKMRGTNTGQDIQQPLHTVTAQGTHLALTTPFIAKYYGTGSGQAVDAPLHTVTAKDHMGLISVVLLKADQVKKMGDWGRVRRFLNEYGEHDLKEDEILLLHIDGAYYYMADIRKRMLCARELYNGMGFPPDYIIERDYKDNAYPHYKQVARCGNAVLPPLAEALIRANLPEICGKPTTTMEELIAEMAV